MTGDLVMTTAEVAKALRLTVPYFRKRRHHLPGFPPPLPGGRTYARRAVVAWLERQVDGAPALAAVQAETRRHQRRQRARHLAVGDTP